MRSTWRPRPAPPTKSSLPSESIGDDPVGWFRYESTTELYDIPPSAVWSDVVLAHSPHDGDALRVKQTALQ